jgi:hypothetical protein
VQAYTPELWVQEISEVLGSQDDERTSSASPALNVSDSGSVVDANPRVRVAT